MMKPTILLLFILLIQGVVYAQSKEAGNKKSNPTAYTCPDPNTLNDPHNISEKLSKGDSTQRGHKGLLIFH